MTGAAPDHLAERPKQSKQQNITYLKSTLMNMINKLPIAAAVLGLALVLTQSAFKNTTQDPTHYKNSTDNTWVSLGSLTPGPNPGMYRCVESTETTICTAYFDPNTNPNPQPGDEPGSSDIKEFGRFILNP